MTKISRKPLGDKKLAFYQDDFWRAVTLLETKSETREFFRDVLTYTERQMLSKRLQIAKLLYQNVGYGEIKRALNVSDTTIGKVSQGLQTRGLGYKTVIPRLLLSHFSPNKKIKKIWGRSRGAQLLAGGVALGGRALIDQYKKIHKRKSVNK